MHYLTHLVNLGIAKEDYSLLAKSSLASPEQEPIVSISDNNHNVHTDLSVSTKKNYAESDDLYSDGN